MIESIHVDSCIHEDPGYLLIAMQCCIMKAVHLFLRDKVRREECYSGILPRDSNCVQTTHKELPPPSCKNPRPSTDKFMEIISSQISPRELHLPLCTKPSLPSSVLFLSAGLSL